MSGKITAALEVLGTEWHVTLCFCDAEKLGKFRTSSKEKAGIVVGVEYWERVDLTVLIIRSSFANERHGYYKSLGYTYAYDFIPHATVGKGDLVNQYLSYIGRKIVLGNEYARTF